MKQPTPKELHFAVLATDVVIFAIDGNALKVLLIDVNVPPIYKNMLGVPGGLIRPDETADDSVYRHIKVKAGLTPSYAEQLYTFSSINRDPRGRVVSVAYIALVSPEELAKRMSEEEIKVYWKDVKHLPKLAYDHNEIVKKAVERLKSKFEYTTIVQGFLDKEFTLSELQDVYEIVLDRTLDKRNFRKKILAVNIVKPIKKMRIGEANRPAGLYTFSSKKPQIIEIL